jgi:peptidoglycan/xylan/chitin deacetylase (PgdA/CDA1 family)
MASADLLARDSGKPSECPVHWFSYPAGAEDSTVVRLVRQAGYLLAVTAQRGLIQSARKPFLFHRDEIQRSLGFRGFVDLMDSTLTP